MRKIVLYVDVAHATATLVALSLLACSPPPPAMLDSGVDGGPALVDAGIDARTSPDAGPTVPALRFTRCTDQPEGGTLECATLQVPVDYANPTLGTIGLPVRRRPAPDQAGRLGSLVWNPGGPGQGTYPTLPPVPYGAMSGVGREVGDRFDLVSIDWRGVGRSMPAIDCDVEAEALFAMASRTDLLEPMDLERSAALADEWLRTCVGRYDEALLARVGSRNAARDLDRLRAAIGDARLNFWGFSYGTTVGATYATMFPRGVRAFVLDSVSLTGPACITPEELDSLEDRLDDFFVWCAAHAGDAVDACLYARGRDAAALDVAWRALVDELDRYPVVLSGASVSGNTVRSRVIAMRLEGRRAFPAMGRALADAEDGRYAALASMPSMPEMEADTFTPYLAIRAADDGSYMFTPAEAVLWMRSNFVPHDDRLARAFLFSTLSQLLWPIPPADGPPLAGPTTAPPLLVVASTGDLATPYANATSLVASLDNGSLLFTYEGTEHAPSGLRPCARDVALAFLLDPTAPLATDRCVGVEP